MDEYLKIYNNSVAIQSLTVEYSNRNYNFILIALIVLPKL